jgi:hypothetical protein
MDDEHERQERERQLLDNLDLILEMKAYLRVAVGQVGRLARGSQILPVVKAWAEGAAGEVGAVLEDLDVENEISRRLERIDPENIRRRRSVDRLIRDAGGDRESP